PPGFLIEPLGDTKNIPPNAPRQNHSLKRIHEDGENESKANDRCPPMHKDEISDDAGIVADSEETLMLGRAMRHVQRLLDRLQFFQHAAKIARIERIRPVALRLLRIVVDFHKHAIHARRDRRARQDWNKLRLPAACWALLFTP